MDPRPGDIVLYSVSGLSEMSSRVVAAGELLAGMGRGEGLTEVRQWNHFLVI